MGGVNSSAQINKAINESIFDMSSDILNETLSATTSTITGSQIQNIQIKGSSVNCDLKIAQDATVVNKVYHKMDDEKRREFETTLDNELKTNFMNKLEQKNDGINFLQGNMSYVRNEIENYNFTDMSQKISNIIQNEVNSEIQFNQEQGIFIIDSNLCESNGGKVEFTQNLNIDSIVENVLESEDVIEDVKTIENLITNDVTNETIQTNAGLFGGIFGAIFLVAIIIGIAYAVKQAKDKKKANGGSISNIAKSTPQGRMTSFFSKFLGKK